MKRTMKQTTSNPTWLQRSALALLMCFIISNGWAVEASAPKAKKTQPVHTAQIQKTVIVPVAVPTQSLQAIEITMPDGSKKLGILLEGKFIPLDSVVPGKPATTEAKSEVKEESLWHKTTYEKKLFMVGSRLLEKNNIQEKVSFSVRHNKDVVNASADGHFNDIVVDEGILNYIDSDDELAAILAHEISHLLYDHKAYTLPSRPKTMTGGQKAKMAVWAVKNPIRYINYELVTVVKNQVAQKVEVLSQNQEIQADSKGMELMKQAGYSPNAMRTVIQKIAGDGSTNVWRTHPTGTVRLAAIDKKLNELEHPPVVDASPPTNVAPVAALAVEESKAKTATPESPSPADGKAPEPKATITPGVSVQKN